MRLAQEVCADRIAVVEDIRTAGAAGSRIELVADLVLPVII